MRRSFLVFFLVVSAFVARAEIQVINGVKYECKDGLCMPVEEVERVEGAERVKREMRPARIAQGYVRAGDFIAFLENRAPDSPLAGKGLWLTLLLVLLGGLAMNLTPCVLPMVPINLMVIGKSASRGAAYGLGIALAYGALGVAAAIGGLAFGTIQSSPWFNAAVALVFVGLALALFDVYFLDFSRFRPTQTIKRSNNQTLLLPFFMGALSAVLAGACVAPILVSVLLLTAKLYAEGKVLALGLPFVLGLGMALPWPFLGAGLQILPRPGGWMKQVNRLFGVVVLGFAVWYGWLAWQGFGTDARSETRAARDGVIEATTETFEKKISDLGFQISNPQPSTLNSQPILVDCWASWCKNCAAMDRVLETAEVRQALERFTVVRLQAEDIGALRKIPGFEAVKGLPAFVIFD